jgi:hypothetical protein
MKNKQKGEGSAAWLATIVGLVIGFSGSVVYVHHNFVSEKEIIELKKHINDYPDNHINNIPSDAVLAFANAPDGEDQRDCSAIGGGWTNFTVADGKFIIGANKKYNAGNSGGEHEVTLSVNNIPDHSHEIYAFRASDIHEHQKSNNDLRLGNSSNSSNNRDNQRTLNSNKTTKPHNNIPPYIALTYCKKL